MPYSYNLYKEQVASHIRSNFDASTKILDVGAGSGVWSDHLFSTYKNMDALEIFEGYIHNFNLRSKYRTVFYGDIRTFEFSSYDYLIMGDILEHLTYEDAIVLLNKIQGLNIKCLVAVPYMYEQDAMYGNAYEKHEQPDLTHEVFMQRYPMMNVLIKDDKYGYYINYQPIN